MTDTVEPTPVPVEPVVETPAQTPISEIPAETPTEIPEAPIAPETPAEKSTYDDFCAWLHDAEGAIIRDFDEVKSWVKKNL